MQRHPLLAQPREPRFAVGRIENVLERIVAMPRPDARGDGEQMPVVVAEHAGGRVAQAVQPAEHGERTRAPVDQVAEHVELVARRRKGDLGEQLLEGVGAALDVADQVIHGFDSATLPARHRCARAWTLPFCSS